MMDEVNLHVNKERLYILHKIGIKKQLPVGAKVHSYLKKVVEPFEKPVLHFFKDIEKIEDRSYSRADVFNFVNNPRNDDLTCAFLIFAWGGMSYRNARLLLANPKPMINNIELIRGSDIYRDDAYHEFYVYHQAKIVKGLGPAFYTKLLYFLGKKNNWSAYIMDQWTALSVNYIFADDIVKMNKIKHSNKVIYTVSGENDYKIYSKFNHAVEKIAKELNELDRNLLVTPDEAEIMIFSEGRGKGLWRSHLLDAIRDK